MMTIEEIQKHPAHAALSEQQRKYVYERTAGGRDKLGAALLAWNSKDNRSAMSMANAAERKPGIRWLIEQFHGYRVVPTREELAGQFWEWAQNAKDPKFRVEFSKLTLATAGFSKDKTPVTPSPTMPDDAEMPAIEI